MIRVIIYCMRYETTQSPGEVNFRILASLEDKKWNILYRIQHNLAYMVGGTRLKLNMAELKKMGCILDADDWNKLTKKEQEDYMKGDALFHTSVKEKGAKNLYKITDIGLKKFIKIKNDCLDHITQRILHVHKKDDDE